MQQLGEEEYLAPEAARRPGRPRTLETGATSLALLIQLIRAKASTKLELEREAEFGRAVVADRVARLQSLGLVTEGERGPTRGGRAPRLVRFRQEAGAILVAVVDRSALAVGLTDLLGALLLEHHEEANLANGPEAILERITTLFIWMLEEYGGKHQAFGIGLSLPEPVMADTLDGDAFGISEVAVLQAWRRSALTTELSLRFGAPAVACSGAQAMTIGELEAGAGRGMRDMLFVKLDHSICAGIVTNGQVSLGAHGHAGMIGHITTGEAGGATCRCGNKGCLEALASGEALAREGMAAARDGQSRYLADMLARNGEVGSADVGHGAQLGDAYCAELLARTGRLVGNALAPLVNLLNPSIIILGGDMAQSGEVLFASVREAVYRQAHPLITRRLRILRSQLGGTAGLVGAAHTALSDIFAQTSLQAWVVHGSPRKEPAFLKRLEAARVCSREAARRSVRSGLSAGALD